MSRIRRWVCARCAGKGEVDMARYGSAKGDAQFCVRIVCPACHWLIDNVTSIEPSLPRVKTGIVTNIVAP
jgi:hypothetical protein